MPVPNIASARLADDWYKIFAYHLARRATGYKTTYQVGMWLGLVYDNGTTKTVKPVSCGGIDGNAYCVFDVTPEDNTTSLLVRVCLEPGPICADFLVLEPPPGQPAMEKDKKYIFKIIIKIPSVSLE